jgi:hypothetical protein
MRIRGLTALALLALLPLAVPAQPAGIAVVGPSLDRTSIDLSGSVRVTLALEGPAPLRVEIPPDPERMLTPESAALWRIRPTGPHSVGPAAEGMERWEQSFRIDWWGPPGKAVLAFAPVRVTAGTDLNPQEVAWPPAEVEVRKTVTAETLDDARGQARVTGIEELPTPPPPDPAPIGWRVAAVLGAVFASVLVLAVFRKWRAKPPPVPPSEWADRELTRLAEDLAAGRVTDGGTADRLAAVVREYVERRYGLPALKLTTVELLAEGERNELPEEARAVLRNVLERCDRSKFAGDTPDAAETSDMIARVRAWVTAHSTG